MTLKDKAWKQALIAAMQSESLQAESEVLPLMQPLGTKTAVALMKGALNDKEFPKPERYADALKATGGDLMVKAYEMGLKLKSKDAQAAFASNLASLPIPDALPLYKAVLAKQVPSVQNAILDHVLKSETKEDLSFLSKLLKSKDASVAFRVAVALGLRGNQSGKKLLLEAVTGDDRDKKLMALQAMKTIATKDIFPHLKGIVKNPKSDIELLTAAYAVYAEQRYEKLAKHLDRRIAESTELEQRAAAVRIIGRVKGSAALDTLHRLLGDGSPLVRSEAAKAIGDIGHRMSLDVVANALDRETATASKVALIETLGAIRDPKAAQRLGMYIYDQATEVRRAVVDALVAIRHADAAKMLEMVLDGERDASIRRTALFGLLQLGPKRYFAPFKRALGWIGSEEVESLVATHKAAMMDHLQLALNSDRAELRKVAFEALRHLSKSQRTKLYSEQALKSTYRDLRTSAIDALVALQGKKAAEVLRALIDDRELEVRVAAITKLGELRDKAITEKLYQLMNASEERVRVAAATSLLRL